MTSADVIASVRKVIQQLADTGGDDATQVGFALSRWLSGEPWESSLGLSPGWRREAALQTLLGLHPDLDDTALGRLIAAGVTFAAPLGDEAALLNVLAQESLSERHWRRLVGQARAEMAVAKKAQILATWGRPSTVHETGDPLGNGKKAAD